VQNIRKNGNVGKRLGSNKSQGVMEGMVVLTLGLIMVKIIGALFKIPLGRMLDGSGFGYYQTAYTIYTPVYTIATAGLPSAVSRLVSSMMQKEKYKDVRAVRKVAMKIFAFTGIVGTAILITIGFMLPYLTSVGIFDSESFDPKSNICLFAMAPAVLFCCLMSGYRGYYQGMRNMVPTAMSEIIEAFTKLIFGTVGMIAVLKYAESSYNNTGKFLGVEYESLELAQSASQPYAAAAAILGVTAGALLGFVYMSFRFKKYGDNLSEAQVASCNSTLNNKEILKTLLRFGIPIALGVLTMNISTLIDTITIQWQLGNLVSADPDYLREYYTGLIPVEKADSEIANYLYGAYGLTTSLFNLVPTVVQAFGVSALPALTAAWTAKHYDEVKTNISSVLKMACLIAIPSGLGMSALAGPILKLLYSDKPETVIAEPMLRVMGITVVFFALLAPINSMLQAVGKQDTPVKLMLIGSSAKIVINSILIGIPEINVKGAPYGTFVSYSFVVVASLVILLRTSKIKINLVSNFVKPLIAGAMCALAAWAANGLLGNIISSGSIVTLLSLIVAVVVYVAAILLLKAITKEDLVLIPKGEKIQKVLEKYRLMG